ncbi:WbuC family cupin fold metalloprotein [Desulfovibrio inopinatus]|uniref:WbuC family cupin fold metalloprotein n=1 Tax=Desulfovibrio inopinatus TaxID=102109 RepID=UPI00041227BF|nr:WbuC family cupin fold metalloprotein [Desulfovibrio inopinatus]
MPKLTRPTPLDRLSPLATISRHQTWTLVDNALIDEKLAHARDNQRKREIHILHDGNDDPLHRMINAVLPGSYVQPHRHAAPPKSEAIATLRGAMGFVAFDDEGFAQDSDFAIVDSRRDTLVLDIRPGVWHTFFSLAPDTVVFEVKPGPYSAADDKDFASWAPAPDSPDAIPYLKALEDRCRRLFGLPPRNWT